METKDEEEPSLPASSAAPADTNGDTNAPAQKKDKPSPSSSGSGRVSKGGGGVLRAKGGVGTNK